MANSIWNRYNVNVISYQFSRRYTLLSGCRRPVLIRSAFTFPAFVAMKAGSSEKRGITPKQAIQVLEKNGCQINEKQAEDVLELMYFLAKLIVKQNFKVQQE